MRSCKSFTDRHVRGYYQPDVGYYDGFVKIRSTVKCSVARRLILDRQGGQGWYWVDRSYWWTGYGDGGVWYGRQHHGPRWTVLELGLHVARTNLDQSAASPNPTSEVQLESDIVTWDIETLRDCAQVHAICHTLTPSMYNGAPF